MPQNTNDEAWCRSLAGKKIGSYILDQFVGAGRIGYVYKAHHEELPDSVRALKLTFGELREGWDVEIKKVTKLSLAEGVVHFHDIGHGRIDHGRISKLCQFTVWDFIEPGEDLKAHLRRVGTISTSFLLAVVERILRVLHACELQGVVRHGDLHSGNILVGQASQAHLDDSLKPRVPVYVSDFGYGATGGRTQPKDDFSGLAKIIDEMLEHVDYASATATHRQILLALSSGLGKLLQEPAPSERRRPMELLEALREIQRQSSGTAHANLAASALDTRSRSDEEFGSSSVGQFQVSEMIGDRWDWWKQLFVPTVPARSRILALDIPTVVTGPRGCGKTMLFRRLSERLVVECGEVLELRGHVGFVALYVNANDFADAFARFPENPSESDEARLICYANVCVLADLLSVQSARASKGLPESDQLLDLVHQWLVPAASSALVVGENRLERYRAIVEEAKWSFGRSGGAEALPGFPEMSQHRWLPRFIQQARECCPWFGQRSVILFVDDFSMPRVTPSMQRVLNRLLLQRSPAFLSKIATEAWSTFIPEDSSGKNLQDGDDYQLVDMGEESLFLPDKERLGFLRLVFERRLGVDPRIPPGRATLKDLLGEMGLSKTEFARRLRSALRGQDAFERPPVSGASQRRGRSRGRVEYFGEDVFSNLWSGDTRTMIQLVSDVLDQAWDGSRTRGGGSQVALPVNSGVQDRVFRNRGGEWLNSHTRNEPTDPRQMKAELERMKRANSSFALTGEYGDHLKAVVEAFVAAATRLLLGPTYKILEEGHQPREVPRMAFRLEIVDEFRIDGLAQQIYRDLIRYGLFMRDNRGKSVRGAFVPRLYLRRLLLPYCTLALSKRDSVPMTCAEFRTLLLEPDAFKAALKTAVDDRNQLSMPFMMSSTGEQVDASYDDLDLAEQRGET